jgi:tungstate transport system substrate-binding protein
MSGRLEKSSGSRQYKFTTDCIEILIGNCLLFALKLLKVETNLMKRFMKYYRHPAALLSALSLIAVASTGLGASAIAVSAQAATAAATMAATKAPVAPTPTFAPTFTHTNERLILATTTSTQDSGLLDYILPDFKAKFKVEVDVIAVGTGQSLAVGSHGDADVVLVHARSLEDAFMTAGEGKVRYDVMYNDFIIVGPTSDPAGIKGLTSAPDAFKQIAAKGAKFVSRGDNSGTYTKEVAIWKTAGITPSGDWYISAGQGMGPTLTMSDQLGAYTLSDRATYAAQKAKSLGLDVLLEGGKDLLNPYGVITVNPDKHPNVNAVLAQDFADWITSVDTQNLIASYKIAGKQVFFPSSALYMKSIATPGATMAATMAAPVAATAAPTAAATAVK